ncbi:MAG: hypothetical protein QM809_14155 [Gordonia sp. (in: high G+C Gram-positive bacteria)]|uniref:hypothetical protein n=1 Tax=Gordonia sp. (in: high G+C Gram-positive bacteria) TaxID=84139 RepID=UPI0039E269DA
MTANQPTRHYQDAQLKKISAVAVVLGLASVLFCWVPLAAPFAGLIAIVLGFVGREKVVKVGRTDYLTLFHAAIVTGILGVVLGVILLALNIGYGPGIQA